MLSSIVFESQFPVARTQTPSLWTRFLKALVAQRTRQAEAFVGPYLASSHPELARDLGYDVEALRRQPVRLICF
jgi:hypothetical protein